MRDLTGRYGTSDDAHPRDRRGPVGYDVGRDDAGGDRGRRGAPRTGHGRRQCVCDARLRGLGANPKVDEQEQGPTDLIRLWDAAFGAPLRYVRGQQRIADAFYARSSLEERKDTCHPTDPIVTPSLRVAAVSAVPWSGKGTRHQVVKSIRLPFALEWASRGGGPR